jgi:hypothetical protein
MHCFIIDYSVLLLDCAGVFDRQVFLKFSALYCNCLSSSIRCKCIVYSKKLEAETVLELQVYCIVWRSGPKFFSKIGVPE